MKTRDEELVGQGWTRRATYDEPRLGETVELYRELGFEVHLEPVASDPAAGADCSECLMSEPGKFKTIYTR